MNAPTFGVLAHSGAIKTIQDFMPRWRKLGVPIIGYLPEGDSLHGIFDETICLGENAHSGPGNFRRMADTLADLSARRNPYGVFLIEYDTVNLGTTFPVAPPGTILSHFVFSAPHGMSGPQNQLCALSPWVFPFGMAETFVDAGRRMLEDDPEPEGIAGLGDRWFGMVCQRYKIPISTSHEIDGYPWFPGSHEKYRRMGTNWIHGWKSKEDFKELWTE